MARSAKVRYRSLRSSLVNLPLSIHGPLVSRGVAPQNLVVELSWRSETTQSINELTSKVPKVRAYLGWTGLSSSVTFASNASTSSSSNDLIELDPQLGKELALPEGTQVSISLLTTLSTAQSIGISPLTPDDWEILALHAESIETSFLNQVRAASPGGIVCVWLKALHGAGASNRTLLRFKVDTVEPATDRAVRLSNDTEVVVAPKLRAPEPVPLAASQSEATPARQSDSDKALALKRATSQLLRVLPSELAGYSTQDGEREDEDAASHERTALVHPALFKKLLYVFPSTKCALRFVPRPKAPSTQQTAASASTSSAEQPQRPLLPTADIFLAASTKVPQDHIWLPRPVQTELALDEIWYPLVRLLAPAAATPSRSAKDASAAMLSPSAQPVTPGVNANSAKQSKSVQLCGVDVMLDKAVRFVLHTFATRQDGSRTAGLLLTGSSGAGKTVIARELARRLERDPSILASTKYVDCSKMVDERLQVFKDNLNEWIDQAHWHAPAVIILDNLHRLLPGEVEHIDSFRSLHYASVFLAAFDAALRRRPIVLIATADSSTSLHPLLLTSHLLGEKINLPAPNKIARRDLLRSLAEGKAVSSDLNVSSLDYVTLSTTTDGYLPADLRDLVDRAVQQAAIRSASSKAPGLSLLVSDFETVQKDFAPLSLRDVKLHKSDVKWSDIGGLSETRRVLRETLEWPTKYAAIFASCPLRLRSGLLLYGFPGCGKTLLASAVAQECGLNFISVKGPEILNKYIGASEKSVRDLFERASAAKPCVLFFDEFDSIAPKRGHDSTGVTDRVVNQMLTQMDGAEGLDGVYVLAATSRPDLIDPALLRPGRLDKSLLCDMPTFGERAEIMRACSRKIEMSPDVDLYELAEATEGFTGADLQALIYNAHLDCIHASIPAVNAVDSESKTDEGEDGVKYITFGPSRASNGTTVLSRAEKAKVSQRLEVIMTNLKTANGGQDRQIKAISAPHKNIVTQDHLRKSLQSTRPSVPQEEIYRLKAMCVPIAIGNDAS
ncbi:uncharacterized protein L969DRAFT_18862 [Mixia osmundae IAM 14324]|uniref:uncharacterized protein n=1 Tax=Mixia osmundae (strain CBS 9802 / IAM 14324 / JCM 22182 / KY 12970) TaxID=764103 RepID=UPI0004A54BE6|nr:uncharacterized protein L969DRAFT_18862 [Mixia osmundae IAM 14324]KEI38078.1 hypothetical protein L969DRAFT_18862 [Mixia osmundae IAM 14324]